MFRVGQGFDAHRLVEGHKLILGGVAVPHDKGLLGHSDADVLVHAICDALLGALALGDIGKHFPPTDPQYKDCDSMVLLRAVGELLAGKGYAISNVDSTIVAQVPKLAPYMGTMRVNIAAVLGLSPDVISVKATTEESMGYTGRSEGISAMAVCLIAEG
ncbi:MAG: 2-C-methyl-D-erythritol 2,4-cyclodiphosphate synthase [Oscillospiraceae bacterium]|nr:2-C-methyl-D-erythritol 2,4-cyclodiphosphate synthase [Oscillospiraceae bacterium]